MTAQVRLMPRLKIQSKFTATVYDDTEKAGG